MDAINLTPYTIPDGTAVCSPASIRTDETVLVIRNFLPGDRMAHGEFVTPEFAEELLRQKSAPPTMAETLGE